MNNSLEIASAGNKGDKVRSDCFVMLEITNSNGLEVDLISKVKAMYGRSIIELAKNEIKFFGIENAKISIEDTGALPFVIAARIEAAVKQLIKIDKDFNVEFLKDNNYHTAKDRIRRSRLYLPGNSPNLMINAGIHKPDAIILDLEDAVAPEKKFEACFLVRNALRSLNFYGAERMVRINQLPRGLDEIEFLIPQNVNLILIPKCEDGQQIIHVAMKIEEIKRKNKFKHDIWLMPIIESALGVINSYNIATAHYSVAALAIGLEDYTADIGVKRSNEATESFFARSIVLNSAKAAGIQAIDSVFSDVADMEALKKNVFMSKSLGFDGLGCIHPRQIKVIHECFSPELDEIDSAVKIVKAFEEANKKGLSVFAVGSKMIDPPVVKRAIKIIEVAISSGKLIDDWNITSVNN